MLFRIGRVLLSAGLLILAMSCFSQSKGKGRKDFERFQNTWHLGVSIGPDFYFGDLNPGRKINGRNLSMGGGLFGEYQVTNFFGFRMQLLVSGLNGSYPFDSIGKTWDNAFTGLLIEGSMNAIINFNNLFSPYKPGRSFFVYGLAGIGYAGWYSKLLNKVYDANTIDTDSPLNNFNAGLVLPVGLGSFYNLKNRFRFGIEWTFHTYLSDKVDNTVLNYKFDVVDYLSFSVSVNLGGKKKSSYKLQDYPVSAIPVYYPSAPVQAEPVQPPVYTEPETYDYVVQVYAFARYIKSTEWVKKKHNINYPVKRVQEDQLYRYVLGPYADLQEARTIRDEMIRKGISDAFIIAYKDGLRHHTVTD